MNKIQDIVTQFSEMVARCSGVAVDTKQTQETIEVYTKMAEACVDIELLINRNKNIIVDEILIEQHQDNDIEFDVLSGILAVDGIQFNTMDDYNEYLQQLKKEGVNVSGYCSWEEGAVLDVVFHSTAWRFNYDPVDLKLAHEAGLSVVLVYNNYEYYRPVTAITYKAFDNNNTVGLDYYMGVKYGYVREDFDSLDLMSLTFSHTKENVAKFLKCTGIKESIIDKYLEQCMSYKNKEIGDLSL